MALLAEGLTNGDWIAVVSLMLTLVVGFVVWLTNMSFKTGRILRTVEGMAETQKSQGKALDSHDDRLHRHDIRLTKLEKPKPHGA